MLISSEPSFAQSHRERMKEFTATLKESISTRSGWYGKLSGCCVSIFVFAIYKGLFKPSSQFSERESCCILFESHSMASSSVRWELCESERKESESGISFSHNPMHFAEAVTFGRNIFLAFPASSAIKNGIAEVAKKKQLSWVMFSTSVQNTFSPKILFCKFTQKENIIVEDLLVHVNVGSMSSKEQDTFYIVGAFKIVCSRPRTEQGCCEISIFIT